LAWPSPHSCVVLPSTVSEGKPRRKSVLGWESTHYHNPEVLSVLSSEELLKDLVAVLRHVWRATRERGLDEESVSARSTVRKAIVETTI